MKKNKKIYVLNIKDYQQNGYVALAYDNEEDHTKAKQVVREEEKKFCKSNKIYDFREQLFKRLEEEKLMKTVVINENMYIL